MPTCIRDYSLVWLFAVTITFSDRAIAEVFQFTCKYESYHSVDSQSRSAANNFTLKFLVDVGADKSYMIGNNGSTEVTSHFGTYGITLLEVLATGAVQSTTIGKGGSSVHSRHTLMPDLFPTQYYGRCKKQ